MVATAATAAPLETPMRPGSARGLRKQALHGSARNGEATADQYPQQNSRQANAQDDGLVVRLKSPGQGQVQPFAEYG